MTADELAHQIADAQAIAETESVPWADAIVELAEQLRQARDWNVRMRRICTAARKWRAEEPHRRIGQERELIEAIDDAVAKEDSRPLEVQIGDARRCLEFWTTVLAELDARLRADVEANGV